MPAFIPGLRLSERFYRDAVRPILECAGETPPHAAALIGTGSEVLGFDTEMSMDHDWGLRLQLFVPEGSIESVSTTVAKGLPESFLGFPTSYSFSDSRPDHHHIEITSIDRFLADYLAFDPAQKPAPADWLTFPEQKLCTLTKGKLFHDDLGLEEIRARFAVYPDDVWRYQLASVWTRIGQEEHLVGRAGFMGDEIGALIIAARLVRDLMRLTFLMERVYAPYPKWFGTAFARLESAPVLGPMLHAVLRAEGWQERDARLVPAYEFVARMHNRLGLTEPRPERSGFFHDRPFHAIEMTGGFAEALRRSIRDPEVSKIAARDPIGGIDVFSDSTDLTSHATWRTRVRRLYEDGNESA